jgi:hypothetical protein
MQDKIFIKNYENIPSFDSAEILRYAGCKDSEDEQIRALLKDCLNESAGVFSYRVCYRLFDVKRNAGSVTIGELQTDSAALARRLEGCEKAVTFAATVGLGIDRFIERSAGVATAKAVLFQAIGAERIEALCDAFCEEFQTSDVVCGRRFSPGYGDFPLTAQKEIFTLLRPEKHIGVTLLDSCLMSPTKSVTAAFGLKNAPCQEREKGDNCAFCGKADCGFKKAQLRRSGGTDRDEFKRTVSYFVV